MQDPLSQSSQELNPNPATHKTVEEIRQDEVLPIQGLKLYHFQLMSNVKFVSESICVEIFYAEILFHLFFLHSV